MSATFFWLTIFTGFIALFAYLYEQFLERGERGILVSSTTGVCFTLLVFKTLRTMTCVRVDDKGHPLP